MASPPVLVNPDAVAVCSFYAGAQMGSTPLVIVPQEPCEFIKAPSQATVIQRFLDGQPLPRGPLPRLGIRIFLVG